MKKLLLTVVAAAALTTASAQNSAVTNAILNKRQGLLDKARTDIDNASKHEKTSGKAKTWFTRGEIYEEMAISPIYSKSLKPGEGNTIALESYQKTIELDGPTGEYGKQAVAKLDNLKKNAFGLALNAGVESYNAKNYDEAIKSYQLAQQYMPQDTTSYLYAAFAAEAKQDYATAKQEYKKLQAIPGYKASPQTYGRLLQIARQEKNDQEATQVVQQALKAYPNNKAFMLEELNMDLSAGRSKEALAKIDAAIAADPKNSNLYAVKGSLLDQAKQPSQALDAYRKAVEIQPDNFDANFNLGIYNYNKAAELYTKASKMSLAEYNKSGKKYEADGKKYFQDSLPYFEKALQVQPEDRSTISALGKVYAKLGRNADAERMNTKLDSLK